MARKAKGDNERAKRGGKGGIPKIISVKVSELKPFAKNPRINEGAVEAVSRSIERWGFYNPILINSKMEIIAGHTRYKAAAKLGAVEIPAVVVDVEGAEFQALNIMDNRSAELSRWDFRQLADNLNALTKARFPVHLAGFTAREASRLIEESRRKVVEAGAMVPFTEELHESNNYLLIHFDNDIDWTQAVSIFKIKTVRARFTKFEGGKQGVGRVLKWKDLLRHLKTNGTGGKNED